jgi:serine/threonine protein kinase
MTDFFFNEQRKSVVIHGKKRRKKFRFIGEGGFRAAFMITEYDGTRRVLKTLIYDDDRDFNPLNFERMRRDAVISEQLTASPYIADIYGYCAQSALVDYSNNRDLDYIFEQKTKPTKDELFQIAHDVAQSIADAHHFNDEGRATIVHMDIKPDQWILLDGRYKLNDFNLARFLTWDPEKQQNCNVASGYGFRVSYEMNPLCTYVPCIAYFSRSCRPRHCSTKLLNSLLAKLLSRKRLMSFLWAMF